MAKPDYKKKNPRRSKKESTPGRRLLNKIRPFTVWPLNTIYMVPLSDKHSPANDECWNQLLVCEEDIELWNQCRKKIIKTIRRGNFSFLDNPAFIESFTYSCFVIVGYTKLFLNAPTIKEYERDVLTFIDIADRFPGFIGEAAEELYHKYNGLIYLSQDYAYWGSYLKRQGSLVRDWSIFKGAGRKDRDVALFGALSVYLAFPDDHSLIAGRPKNLGLRWFVKEAKRVWWPHVGDPENKPQKFHSFIKLMIYELLQGLSREEKYYVEQVLAPHGQNVTKIVHNIIHKKERSKRDKGRGIVWLD